MQNRSGQFRVRGRSGATLASSAMRQIGHYVSPLHLYCAPTSNRAHPSYLAIGVFLSFSLSSTSPRVHFCGVNIWYTVERCGSIVVSVVVFPILKAHLNESLKTETFSFRVLFYGGKYIRYTVEKVWGCTRKLELSKFYLQHFRGWPKSVYAKIRHRSPSHERPGPFPGPGLRHWQQTGLAALSACPVGARLHVSSLRHLVFDVKLWGRVVRSFLFGKWSGFQGKITQSCAFKTFPERPHYLLLFRFVQLTGTWTYFSLFCRFQCTLRTEDSDVEEKHVD